MPSRAKTIPDSRFQIKISPQLKIQNLKFKIKVVIPAGLEPATRSLEGCCSIQLSYETKFFAKI